MKNKSQLAFLVVLLTGMGIAGSTALAFTEASRVIASTSVSLENEKSDQSGVNTTITLDGAKKIAEAKFGGTASSASVDDDQIAGHIAYEVKINGQEVKIDGQSGAIVSTEKDDGDSTFQDKETNDDGIND